MRKEILNSIPNFLDINELPKFISNENEKIKSEFASEDVLIKNLDYYYSNSISRASKTMSECRQIRQKLKKTGTNN